MKKQDEPVEDDECVLRLIWWSFLVYDDKGLARIAPAAFKPKKNEIEGISVFREACLDSPDQVLEVISPEKRSLYAIARLKVADLLALGLSVKPDPIQRVSGHAVIPELSISIQMDETGKWTDMQKRLAVLAFNSLERLPTDFS